MRKFLSPIIVLCLALCTLFFIFHPNNLQQYPVDEWTDHSTLVETDDSTHIFQISPDALPDYATTLAIRSSLQTFIVSADGVELYCYLLSEDQPFGSTPPSAWHFISIPEGLDGPIEVQYSSPYELHQSLPTIYYGTYADLLLFITMLSQPAIILSFLILIVGLILVFSYLLGEKKSNRQLLLLGIFLLLFALWSWGESKTYYFNYTSLFWQSQITVVCVMLLPIPIIISNRPYCTGLLHRINEYYLYVSMFSTGLGLLLQASGLLDLMEYLLVIQILLLTGCILVLVVRSTWMRRTQIRHEFLLGAGFLVLAISVVIEVILYLSAHFIYTGLAARIGVFAVVLSLIYQEHLILQESYADTLALKVQLERATTHLMSNQMKPHFIHNTLQAIQESCYRDPMQAYEAIGTFSRYIRSSLENPADSPLVPFHTELEHVNLYVYIQKLCYEDAIDYSEEIQFSNFYIPPFTIQPIVENAIVHGIRKRRGAGLVELKVFQEGTDVVITVSDNGVGFLTSAKPQGIFSSTEAVVYRIEKLLGGSITVDSRIGSGTLVTIRFPQKTHERRQHLL